MNSGGSVYKTTNGGVSWKRKAHFQRDIFKKIKFFDKTTGFALSERSFIGDTIHIIKSTDGGESWHELKIDMFMVVDFIPLNYNEFLKSNNVESAWFYQAIERYDGYSWQVVYDVPRFINEFKLLAYGNILQFQKVGSRILALGASKMAKLYNVIQDSVSFIIKSLDNGYNWDTLWCDLNDVATTFYFVNDSIGWMGFEYN